MVLGRGVLNSGYLGSDLGSSASLQGSLASITFRKVVAVIKVPVPQGSWVDYVRQGLKTAST